MFLNAIGFVSLSWESIWPFGLKGLKLRILTKNNYVAKLLNNWFKSFFLIIFSMLPSASQPIVEI